MNARARHWTLFAVIVAILLVIVCFAIFYPTGKKEIPPEGYVPLRDDRMAARYMPVFDCPPEFGPILAVYYRAAIDNAGIVHIAYHPSWARERNDTKAFAPFLSRILYTGGLSIQRLMYGPGDIEAVALAIDLSSGKIMEVDYETAADYDPSSFSVRHQAVSLKGSFDPPLRFRVTSWNHLFALADNQKIQTPANAADQASANAAALAGAPGGPASVSGAPLSYFTPELWTKYSMWKNPETILRKDRAHFVWERGATQ
ncbi:MAG: hypothetical protein LLF89_01425 [Spirochaetaceae bacterium]|nr:hypothetical protein [Spirochaetaceae bacterium]